MSTGRTRSRWGLRGKLITAMLMVGAVPLVAGMSLALIQGTRELHEMAGVNFASLAGEAARTVDLVFADELTRTARIARAPLVATALEGVRARQRARAEPDQAAIEAEQRWAAGDRAVISAVTEGAVAEFLRQQIAQPEGANGQIVPAASRAATKALFITDAHGVVRASTTEQVAYRHDHEPWWEAAFDGGVGRPYLSSVVFDRQLNLYTFHLSMPVMDSIGYRAIGVLHRVFEAREYLGPSVFPIRFGKTGHVMLLDSDGTIIACPILATGTRLADPDLVMHVTGRQAGWVKADSDGHGGLGVAIIGFSPLPGTNAVTRGPMGKTWHTFVWQASEELSAPTHHFVAWLAGFGTVAAGLLAVLGYLASGRIVGPIRQLQRAAALIGKGELTQPIVVRTGDELEVLADEMNRMKAQLERAFSGLTDTVEQKSQEVRSLQAMNQQIVESVPTPIVLVEPDGRIRHANRAARIAFAEGGEIAGSRLDEGLGVDRQTAARLRADTGPREPAAGGCRPGARDPLSPPEVRMLDEGRGEVRIRRRVYRYESFRLGASQDEGPSIGLVFRDVTEERRLEEQVVQAEKFSGLARMTAGLGHELNNPLYGIIGLAEAIAEESNTARVKAYAQDVALKANRIAQVLKEVTGQALHTEDCAGPLDCNVLIEELVAAYRSGGSGSGVDVHLDLGPIPPIEGRPGQLRQALKNVLTNAVQAMNGRGVLRVATSNGQGRIAISVADSGCGIPQPYMAHVFDPFFTTKRQGEGRGLGLTVARRLVEALGGSIEIESEEGRGTTVTISLPIGEAAAGDLR